MLILMHLVINITPQEQTSFIQTYYIFFPSTWFRKHATHLFFCHLILFVKSCSFWSLTSFFIPGSNLHGVLLHRDLFTEERVTRCGAGGRAGGKFQIVSKLRLFLYQRSQMKCLKCNQKLAKKDDIFRFIFSYILYIFPLHFAVGKLRLTRES